MGRTDPLPPPPPRVVRLAHRLVLTTSLGPLRTAWARSARALARVAGGAAARGEHRPAVYTRGGLGRGDFVPGLSDVDVIVVVVPDAGRPGAAADRVRGRWASVVGRSRTLEELFGEPRILEEPELEAVADRSLYTFGLDARAGAPPPTAFRSGRDGRDVRRMLERPGLEGPAEWVRLAGPERRPRRPTRPVVEPIAAWLELGFYWRHALVAAVDPGRPRAALLSVKLVSEPTRILLGLQGLDVRGPRRAVLERGLRALPEEEVALRLALDTERQLRRRLPAPFAESVTSFVRLSDRIARVVDERAFAGGGTPVRLLGHAEGERLPLCDWRAIVEPSLGFETMTLERTPVSAASLGPAAGAQTGSHYAVLRSSAMLVLPTAVRERATLRAVGCQAAAPVSHALLDGEASAVFPAMSGWSVQDVARRAVAEHGAALRRGAGTVDDLLGAARAALLHQAVARGAPELALTRGAVLAELRAHAPATLVDELADTPPTASPAAVAALARHVGSLLAATEPGL